MSNIILGLTHTGQHTDLGPSHIQVFNYYEIGFNFLKRYFDRLHYASIGTLSIQQIIYSTFLSLLTMIRAH